MILLIDNYDSFSYNLFQLIGEIEPDIKIIRNDEMTIEEIKKLNPSRIILSPGPGRPEDAGIIIEAVKTLGRDIPVLGVCLGHQAICAAFGTTVTYAKELMHGKQSNVKFDTDCPLFKGCPDAAPVARYHSLNEVQTALHAGARIVGVNNRNLKDFSVDTDNSRRLRELIPRDMLFVSESGVSSAEDISKLREIGVDAVLIGEVLMRAPDKKAKLDELRGTI